VVALQQPQPLQLDLEVEPITIIIKEDKFTNSKSKP
jgi:hypothetical protein